MKVALYARVSKALEQNPENQLIELRRWAAASNHAIQGEYVDEISSKDTRPNKERILQLLRLGELDGVAFISLDRWGRTMSELVLEIEEFQSSNKIMMSLKEGLDLTTAAGRLFAHVLAAMANFERDRIRERTLMGQARAKAQGKRIGRHPLNCLCGRCKLKKEVPPANPPQNQYISTTTG
jgi:DNA invertase Pin-like site-specific DNA recombinase